MLPYFTTFVLSFSPTYSAEPAVDNRRISWFVHPVIQDESVFLGFPLLDDTGADNVGNGGPRHDVEGRKGERILQVSTRGLGMKFCIFHSVF